MFEVTEEIERVGRALDIAVNHFAEANGVLSVNGRSVENRRQRENLVNGAAYEVKAATVRYDAAVERAKKAEAIQRPRRLKAS